LGGDVFREHVAISTTPYFHFATRILIKGKLRKSPLKKGARVPASSK
jgi:hypothetical protein